MRIFRTRSEQRKIAVFFVCVCFLLLITRIPFWFFMHHKALSRAGKYIIYFLYSSIVVLVSSGRPDSDSTRQWTASVNGHRRTHKNLSTAIAILDGNCHGHSVQWNSNWLCCWWFHSAFALFATRGREAHQDRQRYSSRLLTILGRKWSVIEFSPFPFICLELLTDFYIVVCARYCVEGEWNDPRSICRQSRQKGERKARRGDDI